MVWVFNRQSFGFGGLVEFFVGGNEDEWHEVVLQPFLIRHQRRSELHRIVTAQFIAVCHAQGFCHQGLVEGHDTKTM